MCWLDAFFCARHSKLYGGPKLWGGINGVKKRVRLAIALGSLSHSLSAQLTGSTLGEANIQS